MKMKNSLLVAALLTTVTVLAQDPPERSYIVRVARPERASIAETVVKTGYMEAPATVDIFPKISGRLIATTLDDKTNVTEGTRVKHNDVIGRVDPRDYQANLEAAEAMHDHAKATLDDAHKEFARTEALLEEGTATEQEADRSKAALLRAEASLKEAETRVVLARIDLEETEIRAPFDGRIAAKHAYTGAMLTPNTPVYTLMQMDPLRLFFDLPTTAFAKIKPGTTPVAVIVDAYPDETLNCVICNVHPAASATTRTVKVEMQIENPNGKYLPGMYARGEIALNRREDVLVIPRDCIIKVLDRDVVYKVIDARVVTTEVKLGIRQDDRYEVLSGLTEDDDIVTMGLHRLTDGVPVRIETE